MQLLTDILSRAVSDVSVSRASVATSTKSKKYFIAVTPDHAEYWGRFKERYPDSIYLARSRGARVDGVACPEFTTTLDLLNWLSDVLGLTQGERKLLRFCSNVVRCHMLMLLGAIH